MRKQRGDSGLHNERFEEFMISVGLVGRSVMCVRDSNTGLLPGRKCTHYCQ
jgi:hypothetical protein